MPFAYLLVRKAEQCGTKDSLVSAFVRFYNNRTDQLRTSFSTHITTIFMFSICISLSVPDVDHYRRLNSCLPTAHHTTNYSADYTNCRAHHIYSHLSFLSGPLPQSVRWCCPHTSLTSPSPLLSTTVPITLTVALTSYVQSQLPQ
jgi:hypothetical protein